MAAFGVIVLEVLTDGIARRMLAKQNQPVQTLGCQRSEKSLEVPVHLRRQLHPIATMRVELFG